MPPAARILDMHTCPMQTPAFPSPIPHVGGPVNKGEPKVLIGFMPAARQTDTCVCVGPPDAIAKGALTVRIGYLPAARLGDPTMHGGQIAVGFPSVMVGDTMTELGLIARAVNPLNGTVNCGNIIDAVVGRLDGTNPNGTAPTARNGSWAQIEARHNTSFDWGNNFSDAFAAVRSGGPGTVALIGILYPGGTSSHVVTMVNQNGTVAIIEGQGGGAVVTTPAQANARYNSGSDVGIAILP